MKTFTKDSADTLDYAFDWAGWLAGDTISSSSWSATTGLTVASSSNTTTTATVFVSGGTTGTTYTVSNTIITAGQRTKQRSFLLTIEEQ